jgi:hypothetical protein
MVGTVIVCAGAGYWRSIPALLGEAAQRKTHKDTDNFLVIGGIRLNT